jgi:hypothetical protein
MAHGKKYGYSFKKGLVGNNPFSTGFARYPPIAGPITELKQRIQ